MDIINYCVCVFIICRCLKCYLAWLLVFTCCIAFFCALYFAASGSQELNTSGCLHVRRPLPDSVRTNSHWQTQDTGDDKLVAYSAYYDDRLADGAAPWIRVLAVAKLASRPHYCHMWYREQNEPYITRVVVTVIGRAGGYFIRNTTYVQYMLSCQLPDAEPVPSHVSIVSERCAKSTIYLPVVRPVRAEPDIEFGVCVAIAFGHIPTPVFVEWMELTWILGVREFNVYDAGMVNMSDVFDYYTRRGWLKVHQMPPPVPAETFPHTEHQVSASQILPIKFT